MPCGFPALNKTDCTAWKRPFLRAFRRTICDLKALSRSTRATVIVSGGRSIPVSWPHATMKAGIAPEYMAVDLRAALRAVGEITGAENVEEILDSLFAQFCIGK